MDDIVDVFNADRDANQVLGDTAIDLFLIR